jgi:hypothetical protein
MSLCKHFPNVVFCNGSAHMHISVGMDPGQTRSVNKVKAMGQKGQVNDWPGVWDGGKAYILQLRWPHPSKYSIDSSNWSWPPRLTATMSRTSLFLHYKREKMWCNEILSFTIIFYGTNIEFSCCVWVLAQTLTSFWWKGGEEILIMFGFVNRTSIQCIYATKRLRKAGRDHCQANFSFCHMVRSHDVDRLTLLTWPGQYWLTRQLFDLIDRGSTGSRQHCTEWPMSLVW